MEIIRTIAIINFCRSISMICTADIWITVKMENVINKKNMMTKSNIWVLITATEFLL